MPDGLALAVSEGGKGLDDTRDAVHERVPCNAPHVFNLGAKAFSVMFYDGLAAVNIMSFLHTLTDNSFLDYRRNVSSSIPSGMTLAE